MKKNISAFRWYVASTLLLFSPVLLKASGNWITKGDRKMAVMRFPEAAAFYNKAVAADSSNIIAWEKLAQAYSLMPDWNSAANVYEKLTALPASQGIHKFKYGQALSALGKYDAAARQYNAYFSSNPGSKLASGFSNYEQIAKQLSTDNKIYELSSIPENSPSSDIGPSIWWGALTFTSNKSKSSAVKHIDFMNGKSFYDIYAVSNNEKANNEKSVSKAKGKANSRLNDGPATFSHDGSEMIFTRTNKKRGDDGYRRLGLYTAKWDPKKGWTQVKALNLNSNNYNVAHPTLSKDGTRLYFVSDMPGGHGETDIYMSLRNGSVWEAPVNLGTDINTSGRELFPFIANDGSLYFSSDARAGLGGLDVYGARKKGNGWGTVFNPGFPVNTVHDDFGYVLDEDGKGGYQVSNRPGGMGDDDVYRFIKKGENICGVVADAKTKKPIKNAEVKLSDAEGNTYKTFSSEAGTYCLNVPVDKQLTLEASAEGYGDYTSILDVRTGDSEAPAINLVPKGGIDLIVDVTQKDGGKLEGASVFLINEQTGEIVEQRSPENGIVKFDLFPNQQYKLKVGKVTEGGGVYDRFEKAISTMGFTKAEAINEKAELTRFNQDYIYNLPNIYFDLNSSSLKADAQKELDKIVVIMNIFPRMEVEMSAHTDSRGSAELNMKLSVLRAKACVDYLSKKGIDAKRLLAQGYGETQLKNKCKDGVTCTEAEHAINRRSEFKVLKLD